MGNHYDPHYDAMIEAIARRCTYGDRMKASINAIPSDMLFERLADVYKLLDSVGESVIGATAVNKLQEATAELGRMFNSDVK
jgi:hypothetical protein